MSKCKRCNKCISFNGPPEFAPLREDYCDCIKTLEQRAEKAEARVAELELLQRIVEGAAVLAESDEDFGRMVRVECEAHKRSKNDEQ